MEATVTLLWWLTRRSSEINKEFGSNLGTMFCQ